MIEFDEAKNLVHLKTNNMSYILQLDDALTGIYWGAPVNLKDFAPSDSIFHSSMDWNTLLERSEYPIANGRQFTEPCLIVQGGSRRAAFFTCCGFEICKELLTVTMKEEYHHLTLTLQYKLYPESDSIARTAHIRNEGPPVCLLRLFSGALNLPPIQNPSLRYLTGQWAGEFQLMNTPISTGTFVMESKRGLSGPHFNPTFAISQEAGESHGNVWYGALACSGNWKISIEKTIHGNLHVLGGQNDFDGAEYLETSQSLNSPEFIFGFTEGGFGQMSRKLHEFENKNIAPSQTLRRVLYNSWEVAGFDIQVDQQKKLAQKAAQMGVELFVLDDGWFGRRNSDTAGLGDWYVNTQKFPSGLGELSEYVQELGMDFGIWVEPESVNPDSDLYRIHPEWVYNIQGVTPMTARNQLVLNLSLEPVQLYIQCFLSKLLTSTKISFLKWDMNRAFTDVAETGSLGEGSLWRKHRESVTALWSWLRREFPHVELEVCAGGGGRVDLESMRYSEQFWPSDNTDPYDRLFIQEGFTQFYPAGKMMCWVTDSPQKDPRGSRNHLAYKFHSAMCGGLGIGSNIENMSQEDLQEYGSYIAQYKEMRETIQTGDLYRLSSASSGLSAVEYISRDGREIIVFAFLHSQKYKGNKPSIQFKGLEALATYTFEDGTERSGNTLMHYGIPLDLQGDFASVCLRLQKQSF
jgi:alpha-galactosidase